MSDIPRRIITVIETTNAQNAEETLATAAVQACELSNEMANELAKNDDALMEKTQEMKKAVDVALESTSFQDPLRVWEARQRIQQERDMQTRVRQQAQASQQTKPSQR
ncbi:MAG: hypothetical protein COV52_02510 [Gammaproteobacteria bacterium CG11_big_fil_rev_8_21_14_0_20_46_22]|nr:MAG: hypothetical protein COW05_08550 [Gammaproteobacteria bacterium CG12_big_fil_rev_8_21_14_0_65_46_12]PIR11653.1 MAG: hypothetical protein COV52_02510 [Gammaproteobacteria bacterium CG11_big_fil_rev_8_21_14_0_20_46_22]